MSYPHSFKNYEEWHKVLDKIIYSFDIIANGKEMYAKNTNWQEQSSKLQEGLDLFAKHFRDLWD